MINRSIILVAILLLTACTSLDKTGPADPGATQTSMAGSVAETVTAYAKTVQPTPRDTPTVSLTPENTLTPTPYLVTFVTQTEVNCRSRTDDTSDILLVLPADFTGTVTTRDPSGRYLSYQKPGQAGEPCWINLDQLKVNGNLEALFEITSIPSPTPETPPIPDKGFVVSRIYFPSNGGHGVYFSILNSGKLTWESWRITLTDNTTGKTSMDRHAYFYNKNFSLIENLPSGTTTDIGIGLPGLDTKGHEINALVTLCSGNFLDETCLSQTIKFISEN